MPAAPMLVGGQRRVLELALKLIRATEVIFDLFRTHWSSMFNQF